MPSLVRRVVGYFANRDINLHRFDLIDEGSWSEYRALCARSKDLSLACLKVMWNLTVCRAQRVGLGLKEAWLCLLQKFTEDAPGTEPSESTEDTIPPHEAVLAARSARLKELRDLQVANRVHDPVQHRQDMLHRLVRLHDLEAALAADRERRDAEALAIKRAERDLIIL